MFTSVDSNREKVEHPSNENVQFSQSLENSIIKESKSKIASKLARTYSDKHGLRELCKELLNIEISKHQQSSYWGGSKLSKS